MKHKHGSRAATIKVITDPKKLAWLKAEIEKQNIPAPQKAVVRRGVGK